MENRVLIDLSVKYGLSDEKLSKLVDILYQLGYDEIEAEGFKRAANFMCEADLLDLPAEELTMEMKRKGYGAA